ncbi:methyltransferase family protein [Mycolicibacterium holsaticum]|uniref:methyltransferase family protein n=1 Tax=Mycolicibacterium holsaticum TaxID=152142 RepID=UPI001C7CA7FC|nr:isoprenylcysteine carboxylmethyltransferase family protein [Mycolicibacterium holsaticum]MDA4109906.1 membrane protein [Mycolicibacterium holsaticum DSM 44478 = JCM 12374]QZA12165.1 isoprenylcysteine carboxylmethyltransferase family protein [Mycolicibacterium holsaticum DSM 44478 = JCM 12374]UNC10349.1 isoprenylcysteine carboxylmethyltransferase family protein [Mycolicibacterium holsaticum DSM 44478 = JCM 12374]
MTAVLRLLVSGLAQPVVLGVIVFVVAGTVDYWQAWLLVGVFLVSVWTSNVYLLRAHPAALQRRMRGGPGAETRMVQKAVMAGLWLSLLTMLVVSALDHRFGWTHVPAPISLAGNVLVAAGLMAPMLVVIQNNYAGSTVRVEAGQPLASTGLYGLVRHPMYTGNVIMMVGVPLALGSYWGLILVLPGVLVLATRIRDEENLLRAELDGYLEYTQKVRYRLVPGMW